MKLMSGTGSSLATGAAFTLASLLVPGFFGACLALIACGNFFGFGMLLTANVVKALRG